jgi:hypothetical protein
MGTKKKKGGAYYLRFAQRERERERETFLKTRGRIFSSINKRYIYPQQCS